MPRPIRYRAPEKSVTEIRVHGVGNTPPEDLLEDPHPEQVAGDHVAGFFRRREATEERDVEAYSWGGLTSLNVVRSLWLLLAPFMLVNVAGWMVEIDEDVSKRRVQLHAEIQERLTRVVAALLTVAVIVWTGAVTVDLIAFQCGGQALCREGHWWLGWLGSPFFEERPLSRIAVGAIVPLLLLAVLAALGRRSRKAYDEYLETNRPEIEGGDAAGLTSLRFWYRPTLVANLSALHGAATSLTMAALLAFTYSAFYDGSTRDLYQSISAVAGLLALISALGTGCLRLRRHPEEARSEFFTGLYFALASIGVVAVVTLLAVGLTVRDVDMQPEMLVGFRRLPFYLLVLQVGVIFVVGITQLAWWITQALKSGTVEARRSGLAKALAAGLAVVFLGFVAFPSIWILVAAAAAGFAITMVRRPSIVLVASFVLGALIAIVPALFFDTDVPAIVVSCVLAAAYSVLAVDATWDTDKFRWGGVAITSLVGVLLVAGFFTGLAGRTVDYLNRERSPEEVDVGQISLALPPGYDWFGLAFAGALVVMLITAAIVYLHIRFGGLRREEIGLPADEILPPGAKRFSEREKEKVRDRIRAAIAFARTVDAGDLLISLLAGLTALAVLTGVNIATSAFPGTLEFWQQLVVSESYPLPDASWLLTMSSWILAGLPVIGLIALRKAYSNRESRRKLGVLWDVGTFWPRRFHPFAPPSYSERAVPELHERMRLATDKSRTAILAGHSQGSVVSFAVIASSPLKGREKIVLATHGSPLGTLYHRYFPAYFRTQEFRDVATALAAGNVADGRGWRNFHRLTDPIGGPIFGTEVDPCDEQLFDPWWCYGRRTQPPPPLLGHSDYMEDPSMRDWVGR